MNGHKEQHLASGAGKGLREFKLERFFEKHEFNVKYPLCCSDCEARSLKDILSLSTEDELEQWNNQMFGYTETQGSLALRQNIASLYKGIHVDEVLAVVPQEGIFIAMITILKPGDNVVCMWPAYQSLYEHALDIGCHLSLWKPTFKLKDNKVETVFAVEDAKRLIDGNTKMVVVNFPHNPTGFLPNQEDFLDLVNTCRKVNCVLFCDEMYRGLEHNKEDQLASACELYDRAVILNGLSKTYGLPGLRVGWLISQDKQILQAIRFYKDYLTICLSRPQMILAQIAVRNTATLQKKELEIVLKNKKILRQFCDEYKQHIYYPEFNAGSIAFPRLYSSKKDYILDVSEKLIKDYNALIAPAQLFDSEDLCQQNYFRIGIGRQNFDQCLQQLEKFFDNA